jgi:hypothetical protein
LVVVLHVLIPRRFAVREEPVGLVVTVRANEYSV